MHLIGMTGLPRSGKDSVGAILESALSFSRMSFAEPLKEAAAVLLGRSYDQMNGVNVDGSPYDREKAMPEWGFSVRWFLQKLGTECMRQQIHQDFWLTHLTNRLDRYNRGTPEKYRRVVITDVRFDNEASMIRDLGGVIIRVDRPGVSGSSHISDHGITLTENDFILNNDGDKNDLFLKVMQQMKVLGVVPPDHI